MQNTPTPDELLDVVARFLTEVALPQLPPAAAFHARVAANALQVVRRQMALGHGQRHAEQQRLQALLGLLAAQDSTGARQDSTEAGQDGTEATPDTAEATSDSTPVTEDIQEATLAAANARLSRAIATGALAPDDPLLLDHLWQTTFERLAVDQPGYASYRAELARSV